jgi:hypothetical protein
MSDWPSEEFKRELAVWRALIVFDRQVFNGQEFLTWASEHRKELEQIALEQNPRWDRRWWRLFGLD